MPIIRHIPDDRPCHGSALLRVARGGVWRDEPRASCPFYLDIVWRLNNAGNVSGAVFLSSTTVMFSLRVDGVKSGGRKQVLVSSVAWVARKAFSISAVAACVFAIR